MIAFSRTAVVFAATLVLAGCLSASEHRQQVSGDGDERLTVGTVQRDIEVGMSGAQVAEILGSPNVVTTDEERREVWVYDKISTETAFSNSQGSFSSSVLGIPSLSSGFLVGGGSAGGSSSAGAQATSQRTLTVVIKFDQAGLVRDYAYHASRF